MSLQLELQVCAQHRRQSQYDERRHCVVILVVILSAWLDPPTQILGRHVDQSRLFFRPIESVQAQFDSENFLHT
jgi:hypothetical protein